ncbi:MAG: MFS transporter [Chloroflexi bacterium]|nr:MFS transporter [Chloroflexota bacterium]
MSIAKKPGIFYGYVIVAVGFLIMVTAVGNFMTFGVFLGPLLEDFGWTRAAASAAFSITMFLTGALAMVTGRLTDRFGPRLVVTTGSILVATGFFLMSRVNSLWQIYLVYGLLIGVGFSCYMAPTLSTTARWFVKRRSLMTGITMSGVGIGMTTMPLLARWLISSFDWRTAFVVIGAICLTLPLTFAQFLRRSPQSMGQLPYGEMETSAETLDRNTRGFTLRQAVRTRQLWMLQASYFCLGFSVFSVIVHIVIYATDRGVSPTKAASILAIMGILNTAARVGVGFSGDRIGNRQVFSTGIGVMALALVWLLFARELWMLYLFALIFGIVYSTPILQSVLVADLFGLRSLGMIMGVVESGYTLGGTLGPVVLGRIYDVTGSYQVGFVIIVLTCVSSLVLSRLTRPTPEIIRIRDGLTDANY